MSVISVSDKMSTASNSNKRPPPPPSSTPTLKRRKEEDRLRMRVLEAQLTYCQWKTNYIQNVEQRLDHITTVLMRICENLGVPF